MLLELHVKNLALIEKADVEFGEGLNILTGETGAGKSIVIDAMSAVLGQRTSRDRLRNHGPGRKGLQGEHPPWGGLRLC